MKSKKLVRYWLPFILVTVMFIIWQIGLGKDAPGFLKVDRIMKGQLVPICVWVVMALSLNLVVGISGELSLGHAGFMSIGAFSKEKNTAFKLFERDALTIFVVGVQDDGPMLSNCFKHLDFFIKIRFLTFKVLHMIGTYLGNDPNGWSEMPGGMPKLIWAGNPHFHHGGIGIFIKLY